MNRYLFRIYYMQRKKDGSVVIPVYGGTLQEGYIEVINYFYSLYDESEAQITSIEVDEGLTPRNLFNGKEG